MNKHAVVVVLEVESNNSELFKQEADIFISKTRKEEGNLQYNLAQSQDDPSIYVIFELWESQRALDSHLSQPHFKTFKSHLSGKIKERYIKQLTPLF